MLSLLDLIKGTSNLRDKINSTNSFKVEKLVPIPSLGVLAIQARYNALTDEGKANYQSTIMFHDIDFADKKDNDHPTSMKVGKQIVWVSRPTVDTDVQVRCTCKDFYFTWWAWVAKQDSFAGKPFPKYRRKTKTYPERNPGHIPGLCKHLLRLAKYLKDKRVIK